MDTSETYIKICGKAEEIQKQAPDHYEYRNPAPRLFVTGSGDWWYESPFHTRIWLPRQDQLQAMTGYNRYELLLKFAIFIFQIKGLYVDPQMNKYAEQFSTMEQLWLAFVMKEKYGKVWSGEDWIDEILLAAGKLIGNAIRRHKDA